MSGHKLADIGQIRARPARSRGATCSRRPGAWRQILDPPLPPTCPPALRPSCTATGCNRHAPERHGGTSVRCCTQWTLQPWPRRSWSRGATGKHVRFDGEPTTLRTSPRHAAGSTSRSPKATSPQPWRWHPHPDRRLDGRPRSAASVQNARSGGMGRFRMQEFARQLRLHQEWHRRVATPPHGRVVFAPGSSPIERDQAKR